MPNGFQVAPYDRERALEYANYWAFRRNPDFYAFDDIGGDCTNFVSQCMYYANGVMNFTPDTGWYYVNLNDRAPAWTSVVYLYRFLTTNQGPGPFGREVPLEAVEIGDIVQFVLEKPDYSHTVIVTSVPTEGAVTPENILVASHDYNANCRQMATYSYRQVRAIHIDGVRYYA